MNYKIIFTALAVVLAAGSLIFFGISQAVKTQAETSEIKVRKSETGETAEKPAFAQTSPADAQIVSAALPPETNDLSSATTTPAPTAAPVSEAVTPLTSANEKAETNQAAVPLEKTPIFVSDTEFDGVKIVKSEAEWRKLLSAEQFHVLREKGTEAPYTGKYSESKAKGEYHCAACNLALFSSKNKFDSGTGWPSFDRPFKKRNVAEEIDTSIAAETRTEVLCARCGSHLGHVFDDGPEPTGLRYCINSLALNFKSGKK